MGKYRNIKKLLRSNEMGEMLLKSIDTEETKKLIWLLGDDSEDMDEQARLLRTEEIKNSVKCHAYAEAAKAQSQNLNSAKIAPTAIWKRRRQAPRVAMVCLVFLVIFGFTFTKPGIALAKNIGQFVVSLFDNGFTVYTNSNTNDTVMEETITEYASIEEFVEATAQKGAVEQKSSQYTLKLMQYYVDGHERTLCSVYIDKAGRQIDMIQSWDSTANSAGEKDSNETWMQTTILGSFAMDYFIETDDNSFAGIAALPHSFLMINMADGVDYNAFLAGLAIAH